MLAATEELRGPGQDFADSRIALARAVCGMLAASGEPVFLCIKIPVAKPININKPPVIDEKSPSWLLKVIQMKQPVNADRPLIERIQKVNFLRLPLSLAVKHVAAFASSRIANRRELLSGGTDTGVNSRRVWAGRSDCGRCR